MVGIAQLVSAPDCGSGGQGFESLYPPSKHFGVFSMLGADDGLSPSGKAQDFDSCITLVRIQLAQLEQTSAEVQSVFIIRFITFQNIVGY